MTVPTDLRAGASDNVRSVSAGGSAQAKRTDWNALVGQTIEPYEIRAADWEVFSASMRSRRLGTGALTMVRSDPCQMSTTRSMACVRGPSRIGVHLCLSGEFRFDHEGATAMIAQGQAAVSDSTRLHRLRSDRPFQMLSLSLDASDLGGVLRAVEGLVVLSNTAPVASVTLDFIKSSWRALPRLDGVRRPVLQARLGQLLAASMPRRDAGAESSSSHVQSMIYRAKQIALQRIDDAEFGPSPLAEAMGVTRRYLTTLFQSIDDAPADYIRRIRLHVAWDLLTDAECNRPISELAAQVGFKDPVQFSKAVRQRFSATPRDIRLGGLR